MPSNFAQKTLDALAPPISVHLETDAPQTPFTVYGSLLSSDADPCSAWERGINENTNGLILQFFPKGTDFNAVTAEQINQVVALLNNRPRKSKQYRTPNEIFANTFVPLIQSTEIALMS